MTSFIGVSVARCAASVLHALSGNVFSGAAAAMIALGASSFAGHPLAESDMTDKTEVIAESPFDKGRNEFEVLAGALFSFHLGHADRPDFDIATGTLRMGWMLNSPHGDGLLRGNFEFLVEVFGGGVINGPGDALAGGSVLLRYNLVQTEADWVPYIQIGGGGLWNDAYKDGSQRAIGDEFEFNLQGTLGLRYLVNTRCCILVECGYLHISNAGLADRNMGVNALGGRVGASYFF